MSEAAKTADKAPSFSEYVPILSSYSIALDASTVTDHFSSFSSLGHEMINIIFAPKGSPSKSYYIHANRLRAESEYFAGLLRFPGVESKTKTVTLSEGYKGLQDAFGCFVEWLYTGRYGSEDSDISVYNDLPLVADIIVLTEKFIAKRCQKEAVDILSRKLYSIALALQDDKSTTGISGGMITLLILSSFPKIIRKIYEGVPRPYQKSWFERRLTATAATSDSNDSDSNDSDSQAGSSASKQESFEYTNRRVRKLLAEHSARHLIILRESSAFHKVIEDIGEFGCDLMMECYVKSSDGKEIGVGRELVEVID